MHLSNSIINMARCPRRYQHVMIEGNEEPTSPEAHEGLVLHAIYARYIQHLFETGRQTDWDWFRDFMLREMPDATEEAMRAGENFCDWFVYDVNDEYQIELPLAVNWDGEPVEYVEDETLHGRPDLIRISGDHCTIYDWKTGGDIHTTPKLMAERQLTIYAILVKAHFPQLEHINICTFFTRFYRSPLEVNVTEEMMKDAWHLVFDTMTVLEACAMMPYPEHPAKPNSHCKYCGLLKGACPLTGRRRKLDPQHLDVPIEFAMERYAILRAEAAAWEKTIKYLAKELPGELGHAGLYTGTRVGDTLTYDPDVVANAIVQLEIPLEKVVGQISPRTLRKFVDNYFDDRIMKGALQSVCEHGATVIPGKPTTGIWANPAEAGAESE